MARDPHHDPAGTTGRRAALRRFFDTEVAGGAVLLVGTALALIVANSPLQDDYLDVLHTQLTIGPESFHLSLDVLGLINDGLMALFFLVVGLEIKRELVHGELSDRKKAALPVAAALGGMVVPALIYLAINAGTSTSDGWGIPMATDIAFAVGVFALVAPNAPATLKLFLLSLAIADDIGAVAVIAIFYTSDIDVAWLLLAVALAFAVAASRSVRRWWLPIYVVLGLALWVAVFKSGVHASIAGVALGLLTPIERTERLETALHPWSSFLVVPLFAFANAGIVLSATLLERSIESPVTAGVFLGLVVGKLVGVVLFTRLAIRAGLGELPGEVSREHVTGVAALAGIGFTVSIFISSLALADDGLVAEAKMGIFAASLVASVLGALLLRRSTSSQRPGGEGPGR